MSTFHPCFLSLAGTVVSRWHVGNPRPLASINYNDLAHTWTKKFLKLLSTVKYQITGITDKTMANNGKVQSRKHISIMIRHFCPSTCETDTGIRLHCCGLQKRPPRLRTHVLPRTISIKSRRSAFAIKANWGKKKAPQKYANWQIDIRFGLETAEMGKNGWKWRWVKLLIIMCPVIANNGGSGSLVSLLASPWSTPSVIFNWLVLSPQKENPLMNIHVYTNIEGIATAAGHFCDLIVFRNCSAAWAFLFVLNYVRNAGDFDFRFWFEINSWSCVMVTRRGSGWVKWRHKKAGFADLYT